MIASQATTTLWAATVVVVLSCVGSGLVAVTRPPHAAVIQIALAGLIVAAVVLASVRAARKVSDLRTQPTDAVQSDAPVEASTPEPRETPEEPRQHGGLDESAAQHPDVSATLSRRLQTLLVRIINEIDALERPLEDPALLKQVFRIDHLATLARRQSENLAVLGGTLLQRRNSTPMSVREVLRSAVAETERYARILIVTTVDTYLRGHAAAEVVHLLAELMENATTFTNPRAPKVVVNASLVAAGLAVEIQDRGLGIPDDRLRRINAELDGQLDVNVDDVISDGRIGLAVVKLLASPHDVKVRLERNIYGGVTAVVVVPDKLLVEQEPQPDHPAQPPRSHAAPADPVPTPLPAPDVHHGFTPPGDRWHPEPAATPRPLPWETATPSGTPAADTSLPRRRRALPDDEEQDRQALAGTLDVPAPEQQLPALPQRNGTYLHPNLLTSGPAVPAAAPAPAGGHDTGLLSSMQSGRIAAERAHEAADPTYPPPPHPSAYPAPTYRVPMNNGEPRP